MEQKKIKKIAQIKTEIIYPGFYQDNLVTRQNKTFRKLMNKIPAIINKEYEQKIIKFENKILKQDEKKHTVIRSYKTPTKQEILSNIMKQIKQHLEAKEKELFDKIHCDTPISQINKNKYLFFKDRKQLEALEKIGSKIIEKSNQYQQFKQRSQETILLPNQCSPKNQHMRSKSNTDNIQDSHFINKIQLLQQKTDKALKKLGLKSINLSPETLNEFKPQQIVKSQRKLSHQQNCQSLSTRNTQSQNNTSSQSHFKNMHQKRIIPLDVASVISYCNTERYDLQRITNEISKKRRVQFRRFRIIQDELATVGELGFDDIKNKYSIKI